MIRDINEGPGNRTASEIIRATKREELRFSDFDTDLTRVWVKKAIRIIRGTMGRRRRKDYFYLEVGVETCLMNAIAICKSNKMELSLNNKFDADEWKITVLRVGFDPFQTVFYSSGA